jgi:hypothetical protein
MTDTVRIERPLFCRRAEDRGGRVKPDAQGIASKIRTRAADSQDLSDLIPAETTGQQSTNPLSKRASR